MREARRVKLLPPNQIALPPGLQPYPKKYETDHIFGKDLAVHFRPIQPTDERALKELFYSHSPATIYQRYFSELKNLPHDTVQKMVTLDYRDAMAIVAEIPWEGRTRLIGVGRYYRDAATNWAEVAVVVQEDFRQRGLAAFLLRHLAKIAGEQGIVGFTADVLPDNNAMLTTFHRIAAPVEIQTEEGVSSVRFQLNDVQPTG